MDETLTTAGIWLMYTVSVILVVVGLVGSGIPLLLLRYFSKLRHRQAALSASIAARIATIRAGARRGGGSFNGR